MRHCSDHRTCEETFATASGIREIQPRPLRAALAVIGSVLAATRRLPAAAAGLLVVACYKGLIVVPAELAPTPRLAVSGSGQRLAFGEYETLPRPAAGGVGRAAVQAAAVILDASLEDSLNFVVRARGRGEHAVRCAPVMIKLSRADTLSRVESLNCTLGAAGDTVPAWRLIVEIWPGDIPRGSLVGPTDRFEVAPAPGAEGEQPEPGSTPLGYYVRVGGKAIAAVGLWIPGVWLDPALSVAQRDLVAAALAAVLVWHPLADARIRETRGRNLCDQPC